MDADAVTANTVRVAVVDDHPVVLDGVRLLLRDDPAIRVVGSAPDAAGGLALAEREQPDIVLLDLRLPDALASEVVGRFRKVAAATRILLFTAYREHAALQATLDAGVDGCLLKDAGGTDLVTAVRKAVHGVGIFDPRVGERASSHLKARLYDTGLTRREYDVVRQAAAGLTTPEIAAQLGLTRHTTAGYLRNAMRKLGARNRIQLITKASQSGLL
ncbi:MAG: response regulator transcription factor [Saccharopolyspora sp.]|uniref:response regulator transcription factor n=1 Tax=Saccharopolyspora TaxID=1835 RepID=UPI00190E3CF3|nr:MULTISPECIES: response regulator transcription factor [unclassified Saccharopolyspora]MBK0867786.1 response regulator transcription factor [Saccharopolyspora sp. HNM0986]MBQ6639500.1 response regulator transcription factor [Saccharopolyspora sp.]